MLGALLVARRLTAAEHEGARVELMARASLYVESSLTAGAQASFRFARLFAVGAFIDKSYADNPSHDATSLCGGALAEIRTESSNPNGLGIEFYASVLAGGLSRLRPRYGSDRTDLALGSGLGFDVRHRLFVIGLSGAIFHLPTHGATDPNQYPITLRIGFGIDSLS